MVAGPATPPTPSFRGCATQVDMRDHRSAEQNALESLRKYKQTVMSLVSVVVHEALLRTTRWPTHTCWLSLQQHQQQCYKYPDRDVDDLRRPGNGAMVRLPLPGQIVAVG
jgi:hypothetical protein